MAGPMIDGVGTPEAIRNATRPIPGPDPETFVETPENVREWADHYRFATFMQSSNRPASVLDLFRPQTPDQPITPQETDFIRDFEQVFFDNKQNLPMPWLVQQDPADLQLLDPEITDEVIEAIAERKAVADFQERLLGREQELYEQLLKTRVPDIAFQPRGPRLLTEAEQAELRDQAKEEARREAAGQDLSQIRREMGTDPGMTFWQELLEFGSGPLMTGLQVIGGIAGAVGWLGSHGVAMDWNLRDPIPVRFRVGERENWFTRMRAESQQRTADLRAEQENAAARSMDSAVLDRSYLPAQEALEAIRQEDPETYAIFDRMGGGDPVLTQSLFNIRFRDLPQIQQQLADEELAYRREHEEMVQAVEDSDGRLSGPLLNWIGWHGEKTFRYATAAVVAATDPEVSDPLLASAQALATLDTPSLRQQWAEFRINASEAAAKHGNTPSRALGYEGTALGIGIDLALPMVFDWTTYIWGPRLRPGLGMRVTAANVSKVARSRASRMWWRDMTFRARSPAYGAYETIGLYDRFGPVGLADEVLDAVRGVDQTVANQSWMLKEGAEHGRQVLTETVEQMVDGPLPKADPKLRASLKDDFSRAVVAEIEEGTGRLLVVEGADLVAAAKAEGIGMVPVQLRVKGRPVPTPREQVVESVAHLTEDQFIEATGALHSSGTREAFERDAARLSRATGSMDDGVHVLKSRRPEVERVTMLEDTQMASRVTVVGVKDGKVVAFGRVGRFEDAVTDIQLYGEAGRGTTTVRVYNKLREAAKLDEAELMARFLNQELSVSEEAARFLHKQVKREARQIERAGAAGAVFDDARPLPQGVKEGDLVNPGRVLSEDRLFGPVDYEQLYRLEEKALLLGAEPMQGQRFVVASMMGEMVRSSLRSNKKVGPWIRRWLTPQNMSRFYSVIGANNIHELRLLATRLWGKDKARASFHIERMNQATRGLVETQKRLAPMYDDIGRLQQQISGLEDQAAGLAPQMLDELVEFGEMDTMRRQVADLQATQKKLLAEVGREQGKAYTSSKIIEIVQEMADDFNRTQIAPHWPKELLDENGLVPWEYVRGKNPKAAARDVPAPDRGPALPDTLAKQLEGATSVDAEKLGQSLLHTQNVKLHVDLPASPIEMLIASEWGGSKFLQAHRHVVAQTARDWLWGAHRLWVVDKVLKPATAITVSMDEWFRIFHLGGTPAVLQWMEDKAMFVAARAGAVRYGRGTQKIVGGRATGVSALPKRWRKRMQTLQDYPHYFKEAERQAFEAAGVGWSDILPGDPEHFLAWDRWAADNLQDSGFRSMLRGEDDFRAWWVTGDADRLRTSTVFGIEDGRMVPVEGWKQAYEGYRWWWDEVLLAGPRSKGLESKARAAWLDAARQADEVGGARTIGLPQEILAAGGPVRGIRAKPQNVGPISRTANRLFDEMFMDPTNYRRGFLAEQTRTLHRRRLEELYASQGREVISDIELERVLSLHGIKGGVRDGLRPYLQDLAQRQGVITRSFLEEQVEKAVQAEIENTLYSWHLTSRAGRSGVTRGVWPFGKPWAEMWAFYGREVMTRPTFRKGFSKTLGRIPGVEPALAKAPNLRTPALISRVANTEFNADEGFAGEGSFSLDFSPLLFLPKKGEHGMLSVTPGLGLLPIYAIDFALEWLADPIDEPEKYQRYLDQVEQIVPSIGFPQTGMLGRAFGGGSAATLMKFFGQDLYTIKAALTEDKPDINTGAAAFFGDYEQSRLINRRLRLEFSDPTALKELSDLSEEEMELALNGLVLEAYTDGSLTHAGELFSRFMIPARADFDESSEEIADIWIQAAQDFPELHVRELDQDFDPNDPKDVSAAVDGIRGAFFRLPQWKRDLIVVQQWDQDRPNLAINLVTSWEWSDMGSENHPDGDLPYRFDGSKRHENLARFQYIQPSTHSAIAKRIVGTIMEARQRLPKELYRELASGRNEQIWAYNVPADWRAYFDGVAQAMGTELDVRSGEEVWKEWSRIEPVLEQLYAEQAGVDPDSEDAPNISFPDKIDGVGVDAWGETWAGLEAEDFTNRWLEAELNYFSPRAQEIAKGLNIPLSEGMTGKQLVNGSLREISDGVGDSPIWSWALAEHERFTAERGAASLAVPTAIRAAVANPDFDPEFRGGVRELLRYVQKTQEMQAETGELDRARADYIRAQYEYLSHANPEINFSWKKVWHDSFERRYGPLDWEPPEPAPLYSEDGSLNAYASRYFIHSAVDGDTLVVSRDRTAPPVLGAAGRPTMHKVRLLGINSVEYSIDPELADTHTRRLQAAILEAVKSGQSVYFVRDPDRFGETDFYGRELAWIYLGDEPFYFPEDFEPGD